MLATAPVSGLKVEILNAGTDREIDAAFASLVQTQTGALLVGNDALFNSRIEQIVALAARHAIPTMYLSHEFAAAGGLISYGTSLIESYRQIGLYTGRDADAFPGASAGNIQCDDENSIDQHRPVASGLRSEQLVVLRDRRRCDYSDHEQRTAGRAYAARATFLASFRG